MKLFRKGWGGQPDFISLIQKYICTQKYGLSSESGFHRSSTGGKDHRFMKLFHKILLFSGDGFPNSWEKSNTFSCRYSKFQFLIKRKSQKCLMLTLYVAKFVIFSYLNSCIFCCYQINCLNWNFGYIHSAQLEGYPLSENLTLSIGQKTSRQTVFLKYA